jgi:Sec-independent protein secretion pathway component TatC
MYLLYEGGIIFARILTRQQARKPATEPPAAP